MRKLMVLAVAVLFGALVVPAVACADGLYVNPQSVCDAFASIGRLGGLSKQQRFGPAARWSEVQGEWGCTDEVYVYNDGLSAIPGEAMEAPVIGFMVDSKRADRVDRVELSLTFRSQDRKLAVGALRQVVSEYFKNVLWGPPQGLDAAIDRLSRVSQPRPRMKGGLIDVVWKSEQFTMPYGIVVAEKSRGLKVDDVRVVITLSE
jgi:hypothetical protein